MFPDNPRVTRRTAARPYKNHLLIVQITSTVSKELHGHQQFVPSNTEDLKPLGALQAPLDLVS